MKQKFLMMVIAVAASLGQTAALAAEYKVDPVNSFAFYKVKHLGVSYAYGQFTAMEGTISFDPSNADANSVEISIKTDSVSTHNSTRDRHLSGPDFFNAKEFPVMKFKSSSWKKAGDNTYTVSGDLTIAGVTKTVTSTVEHVGDGKNPRGQALSGFHAVFSIDRTEFGMNYGVVPGGGGLGKDIDITISIQAVKQ